jgi:hypothetical protein
MHDANNIRNPIVELIVEEPINFNSGGIRRKQIHLGMIVWQKLRIVGHS